MHFIKTLQIFENQICTGIIKNQELKSFIVYLSYASIFFQNLENSSSSFGFIEGNCSTDLFVLYPSSKNRNPFLSEQKQKVCLKKRKQSAVQFPERVLRRYELLKYYFFCKIQHFKFSGKNLALWQIWLSLQR